MNATKQTKSANAIANGTVVVSMLDGEDGTILQAASYNRNRTKVWSYTVQTQYGREVWDTCDLFIPTSN